MRKAPKQRRSQEMVDALIEATAQTVAERGLADATTNHIAARAGVSVGSLYQYFEGKDALIDALLDRSSQELAVVVDQRLAGLLDAPPRVVVEGLLTAVMDVLQGGPPHHLELLRHWQQISTLRALQSLERHMLDVCRRYLLRHPEALRIDDVYAALFVVINSTLFTLLHYLSQSPPPMKREAVIASLSDMIASYLTAPRDGP